jgi:predicted ATPase/class 3 adenylate cyclase
MDEITSFGEWLRRRRKALDLTQVELADRAGCVQGTIKSIEADARRPSRQLAERLADVLELRPNERAAFLKAARAELSPERLGAPIPTVAHVVGETAQPSAVAAPPALPTGTVTFLFTDIEGSAVLWDQQPQAMRAALDRHDAILLAVIATHSGVVFKSTGDGLLAAFARAADALAAAVAAQRAFQTGYEGGTGPLHVRMALHTGMAEARAGDYFGPPLNRTARLLAASHGGQILLSRVTIELVHDHLPGVLELADLGIHRLRDLSRPEHIFQIVANDLPTDFPPLRTLDAHPNNLPAQPTSLIGREREVADVCALLRRQDVRLLTLTGAGGTGKTRLAIQVAAELLDDFKDGVWFVDLAPLDDPALLISVIMQTLGLKELGGQPPLEQLQAYLRNKHLLILLDNFEQVVDAALYVAQLLAAAPQLKVLVSSRVVLHVRGEREYPVPALALPDHESISSLERLTQYEAVRLFIERAQAVRADFMVTNQNAPAVAEICYRLDGLPLAIELAAALVKLFTPSALLARLDRRLGVLTSNLRDLPARHQTLRATIDWSYNLLAEDEKKLFARMGVFIGSSSLEAAEAVCGIDGDLSIEIVDGVAALLSQNLLRQLEGPDGEPRMMMLETIREYGQERLAERGEIEALWRRHSAYFLALAETAEPQLTGPQQATWTARLEPEHDNLRAALGRALEQQEAEIAMRLGAALWRFWWLRGHVSEGRTWLARVLSHSGAQRHTAARAHALTGAGYLTMMQSDYPQATAILEEGLALFRELGDEQGSIFVLGCLGDIASREADLERAMTLFEQTLAFYQERGDLWGIAASYMRLGNLAFERGDYGRSAVLFEESLLLFRKRGDQGAITSLMNALGVALRHQGDDGRAIALFEEALALCRTLNLKDGTAWSLRNLGDIALKRGDHERAKALFVESLRLKWELGDRDSLIGTLARLASLAVAQGRPTRAMQLYGAVFSLCDPIGGPLPSDLQADYERAVATSRIQLDEAAFMAAWEAGQVMTMERAIDAALSAEAG